MVPAEDVTSATLLPVNVHGAVVSVRGPLTPSTIALVCAAVDYLHDIGTESIIVDLRGENPSRAIPVNAADLPGGYGRGGRVVRLLLPLQGATP